MERLTVTCSLCEASCAALMDVEDGKIMRVRPDTADVLSGGFVCAKGAAIPEIESSAERLRTPLMRRDGKLQPATWDEAFQFIEARLRAIQDQYGRNAVATYAGNAVTHNLGMHSYLGDFLRALGSRNLFTAGTLDQIPRQAVSSLLYGAPVSVSIPDLDRCELLWIIGANPAESNGSLLTSPGIMRRLQAIRDRGRVVVIDPRRTTTAKRASEHVPIRPSTDSAFLAAIVHELLRLGPVPSPVLDLCGDISALHELMAPFSPDAVAEDCGVPADDIRRLAAELRATPHAAIYGRMGMTTQIFPSLVCWLQDMANILAGNMDAIGGAMFCNPLHSQENTVGMPGTGRGMELGRWRSRVRGAPEVLGELPTACLAEEILTPGDGQIRALFVAAGNPIISAPDAVQTRAALESLDLLVCLDIHVSQTAALADVILPSPPRLAKSNFDMFFYQFSVRNYARYTSAYQPVAQDERSDREILLRLSSIARQEGWNADIEALDRNTLHRRVEQEIKRPGSRIAGRDPDEIMAMMEPLEPQQRRLDLAFRIGPHGDAFGAAEGHSFSTLKAAVHGLDLGPLEPMMPDMLRTKSGTIEWHQSFVGEELDRLRDWMAQERPRFVLVGRRQLRSNNSWLQHIPSLQHKTRTCALQMNAGDAANLGLADGDGAMLSTPVGQVEVVVALTEDIASGVVSLPHGWGPDRNGHVPNPAAYGANVNHLVSAEALDPLTGTARLNGYAVDIIPIREAA